MALATYGLTQSQGLCSITVHPLTELWRARSLLSFDFLWPRQFSDPLEEKWRQSPSDLSILVFSFGLTATLLKYFPLEEVHLIVGQSFS